MVEPTAIQRIEKKPLRYWRKNVILCRTPNQLFNLIRIFEGAWEVAQPVYMYFVDLKKAFNPQGTLWKVLWEY